MVLGVDWPWPPGSNLTHKSKFTQFWACPSEDSLPVQVRISNFEPKMHLNTIKIPIDCGTDWPRLSISFFLKPFFNQTAKNAILVYIQWDHRCFFQVSPCTGSVWDDLKLQLINSLLLVRYVTKITCSQVWWVEVDGHWYVAKNYVAFYIHDCWYALNDARLGVNSTLNSLSRNHTEIDMSGTQQATQHTPVLHIFLHTKHMHLNLISIT